MGITRIIGLSDLRNKLRARKKKAAAGFEKGSKKAAKLILSKALEIVPLDTQELYDSGRVEVTGTGLNTEARIKFEAEHAIVVHEDLTLRHGAAFNEAYAEDIAAGKTHARRPQEQAKYIEKPIRENRKEIRDMINNEILKELDK